MFSTPSLNSSIRNLDAWTIRAKLSRERTFRLTKQRQFTNTSGFPVTHKHSYMTQPSLNLPAIDTILNPKTVREGNTHVTPGPDDPSSTSNIIPAKNGQFQLVRKLCSDLSETDMQRQILSNILQSKFCKTKFNPQPSVTMQPTPDVEEEAQRLIAAFQAVRERLTVRNLNLPAIKKAILAKQRQILFEVAAGSKQTIAGPMPEQEPEPIVEELGILERVMAQTNEQIKGITEKMDRMDAEIRRGQELIDEFCSRKVA
jgi:hypothetical protein